jgi:ribosome biogenesis GTPase
MSEGLVIAAAGPEFVVRVAEREVPCTLRGRLKKDRQASQSLVVVGDQVEVMLDGHGGGAIEKILPRRTELARYGGAARTRLVAANLDQLVVVQATRRPDFNRHLVERFLALAARGGMRGLVVVNKCEFEPEAAIEAWVEPLRTSGTPVFLTSVKTGRGIEELRAALIGRLSAMVGQSGVGKSSLINALDPGYAVRTAAVSEHTSKGRHTTSASRLYPLAGGGYLADTPGIRELALVEHDPDAVDAVFPEILAAAAGCRFRGCSHSHEPDCAVRRGVERGEIALDRYKHYVKLRAGDDR